MTDDEELLEKLREENKALEARIKLECASRIAAEHHTKCRDCGHFVSKDLWVRRDCSLALKRNLRPLCFSCVIEYDCEY
jgi:hypothetical protein